MNQIRKNIDRLALFALLPYLFVAGIVVVHHHSVRIAGVTAIASNADSKSAADPFADGTATCRLTIFNKTSFLSAEVSSAPHIIYPVHTNLLINPDNFKRVPFYIHFSLRAPPSAV